MPSLDLKREQDYKTTYKNDWMESIKRLVQSEFEKFEKNCKQRLCKEEEEKEGTIDKIVTL